MAELQRRTVAAALLRTRGNQYAAVKLLGMLWARLYERMNVVSESGQLPETKAPRMLKSESSRLLVEEIPIKINDLLGWHG